MRFYYQSETDRLGIRFKPGPNEKAQRRHEVMPSIFMEFDAKGQLAQMEILNASQHQPEIKQMIQQMVQEVLKNSAELSKEAMLAIEKTLRLDDEADTAPEVQYSPGFSFDAVSNVLVVELIRPSSCKELLPKQRVLPNTFATFDGQGHLVSLEMPAALQQFPDLRVFVEQGQQMLALQHMFKFPR